MARSPKTDPKSYISIRFTLEIDDKKYGARLEFPNTLAFHSKDAVVQNILTTLTPMLITTVAEHFKGDES